MIPHHLRFATLALVFALTLNAWAKGEGATATETTTANGSEFLFQTEAKRITLMPQLNFGVEVIKFQANSEKQANVGLPLNVSGEYGINEMFAAGLTLTNSYVATTFTCDTKPCQENRHASGLADPIFSFKGRNALPKGELRYGADLSIAVEKHKISSSLNGNAASGGHTLTPWVGYEILLGPGLLGGKFSYDLVKTDRKIDNDSLGGTQTDSNGRKAALSAFYEITLHKVTYGAALTHRLREESRTSVNGAPSSPNRDQGSETAMELYVPVQLASWVVLLPSAHFTIERYSNSGTIDTAAEYGIGAAGRFTF